MLEDRDRQTIQGLVVSAKDRLSEVRRTADQNELSFAEAQRAARNIGTADGQIIGTRLELNTRQQSLDEGETDTELTRLYERFEDVDEQVQNIADNIEGLAPLSERELLFKQVETERYRRCETKLVGTLGEFQDDTDSWMDKWDAVSAGGGIASIILGGPGGAAVGAGSAVAPLVRPLFNGLFNREMTNQQLAEQYITYRETIESLKPLLTALTAFRLAPNLHQFPEHLEIFFDQMEVEMTELRMEILESERIYDVPASFLESIDLEQAAPPNLPKDDPNLSDITDSYILGRYLAFAVLARTKQALSHQDVKWRIEKRDEMDVISKSFRHLMTMENLDELGGIRVDERREKIQEHARQAISVLEDLEQDLT
jgi:hypothetical protein